MGLSQADAAARRLEFGSNRIERLPKRLSRFASFGNSRTSSLPCWGSLPCLR
jgi:hypothetical protein